MTQITPLLVENAHSFTVGKSEMKNDVCFYVCDEMRKSPWLDQKTARIGSPKPLQLWVQALEQPVDEKWH